jgi:hypothetical protein
MSNIIEGREKLAAIAVRLRANGFPTTAKEIEQIIQTCLIRKSPVRRAPRKSRDITPAIRAEVIRLSRDSKLHESDIAARLNINPGRVSEILNGKR